MNPFVDKRRYLCKNLKEVVGLLSMAPEDLKQRVSFIYKEGALGVVGFCFQSEKEALACEAALIEYIIRDVSAEKRYKRRYLEQFGLLEANDFDLEKVFVRLETLGETSFHFTFQRGMSTQKVLKVLLYHALIRLEAGVQQLKHGEDTLKRVSKRTKRLVDTFALWRSVFDPVVIDQILERLKSFYAVVLDKNGSIIVTFVESEAYRLLILDISYLLFDQDHFYAFYDQPLGLFVQQQSHKNQVAKEIKKSLKVTKTRNSNI